MFHKILVPLDRSPQTDEVFFRAIKIADSHSQLMLLHILDWNFHLGLGTFDVLEIETDLSGAFAKLQQSRLEEKLAEVRHWLQGYHDRAVAQAIAVESRCVVGHPGPLIRDIAQDWGSDLIVLGRRGLGGFSEMLLGSVSNYVLHHVPCSMLVIQQKLSEEPILDVEK